MKLIVFQEMKDSKQILQNERTSYIRTELLQLYFSISQPSTMPIIIIRTSKFLFTHLLEQ